MIEPWRQSIFNTILAQIEGIIDNPWLLFGLLFILAAVNLFFPPTPLETITLFAAYLSAETVWAPLIIVSATAGGMFGSSLLLYRLTHQYGATLLEKFPLNQIITFARYQKALHGFKRYGLYMIYLGKLVPGMTLYTVLCCGFLKLGNAKVLGSILLSNLIFFFVLVVLGRQLGAHWGNALPWMKQAGLISLAGMLILTLAGLIKSMIKPKKHSDPN